MAYIKFSTNVHNYCVIIISWYLGTMDQLTLDSRLPAQIRTGAFSSTSRSWTLATAAALKDASTLSILSSVPGQRCTSEIPEGRHRQVTVCRVLSTQHMQGSLSSWSQRWEGIGNKGGCDTMCTRPSWEWLHVGPTSYFWLWPDCNKAMSSSTVRVHLRGIQWSPRGPSWYHKDRRAWGSLSLFPESSLLEWSVGIHT